MLARSNFVTPEQLAKIYAVSSAQVLVWYHSRIIPAEVAEGRVYRFDSAKVARALAKRARKDKGQSATFRDSAASIQ
jgi:hypothetical protein